MISEESERQDNWQEFVQMHMGADHPDMLKRPEKVFPLVMKSSYGKYRGKKSFSGDS
jgi:hypothetical protein